jgi:tetratricopeptide (TPR) repeat protein
MSALSNPSPSSSSSTPKPLAATASSSSSTLSSFVTSYLSASKLSSEASGVSKYYFGADKEAALGSAVDKALAAIDLATSLLPADPPPSLPSLLSPAEPETEGPFPHPPSTHLLYLKGSALVSLSAPSPEAEALLTKAVKLYPGLAPASYWNALGECFFVQGKHAEARGCFESGVRSAPNKLGYQQLSMLLRSMAGSPDAAEGEGPVRLFEESISRAK